MEQIHNAMEMLDLMMQPAFCVREGTIIKVNPAAAALLIEAGAGVQPLLHTGTDVQVFAIDDGNGNITIVSADVVAEDDGNGNITLSSSAIVASDDGNGNITLSYI